MIFSIIEYSDASWIAKSPSILGCVVQASDQLIARKQWIQENIESVLEQCPLSEDASTRLIVSVARIPSTDEREQRQLHSQSASKVCIIITNVVVLIMNHAQSKAEPPKSSMSGKKRLHSVSQQQHQEVPPKTTTTDDIWVDGYDPHADYIILDDDGSANEDSDSDSDDDDEGNDYGPFKEIADRFVEDDDTEEEEEMSRSNSFEKQSRRHSGVVSEPPRKRHKK